MAAHYLEAGLFQLLLHAAILLWFYSLLLEAKTKTNKELYLFFFFKACTGGKTGVYGGGGSYLDFREKVY